MTIGGNHFLFNINNWNTSLEQFKKGFEENNINKDMKILKKELKLLLKEDNNVKEIFSGINYDDIKSGREPSLQMGKGRIEHLRNSEFA